ncbi:hypothetical protein EOL96_06980, partial [Candidatus Saccharibacteria bacterium]|nr:hypothetical protein [Candidatus Saccharibacteria bacterium]
MNDTIDSELQKDFEWFISYWVGRSLHESKFGKIGLRWKMTKTWNSRIAHAGIPGRVRDVLGEENATRLFQDISDQIINDPAKAAQAKDDFISFGHHRTDDVKTEINDSASSASSADAKRYLSSKGVTDSIADIAVLSAIISTLTENDLGHELYNYENNLFTSVRGYGTIFGNRLPLRMESIFGGYDPMKCQTDEFVDLIDIVNEELKHGSIHYEHIPDPEIDESELSSAKHVLSDLASLQNGGKLVSFVETIIYYNSNIDKPIMGDDLIQLLKKREDDKQIILKRLDMYSFDDTTNSVSQGSQTAPHVSSSPKSGMWQLPPLDLLDDVPTGSIKKSGVVPLKTVLKSDAFTKSDQPLTFALGATNEGTFATVGLKMMGAVLAAGQTGSGKSTFTET